MVFRFSLGIWRVHKCDCVELLDRWRFHDSLWDRPDCPARILDCTELVQHDPWHLDVLFALDLRLRQHEQWTVYQQPMCRCYCFRFFDYLCESQCAAEYPWEPNQRYAA